MKCYTLHSDGTVSPGILLSDEGNATWQGLLLDKDDPPEIADDRVLEGIIRVVTTYTDFGEKAGGRWDCNISETWILSQSRFNDSKALVGPVGEWQPVAPTERIGPGSGFIIVRHGETSHITLADGQTYALTYDSEQGLQVTRSIASAD